MKAFIRHHRGLAVCVLGVLIFAVGVGVGTQLGFQEESAPAGGQIFTDLTLDYGNGDTQSFPKEVLATGGTVLDQLKAVQVRYGVPLEMRSFPGMGEFVEGIHGVRNTNMKYWQFWVNGTYAEVGASQYVLSNGDQVLWKRTDEQ
ncbi:MAG: DUF4430 domain-containing protein [bacterium]|nr:DUF4430 domain-containing protein [bacterium]MDZ4231915.1 DUF4430 domain-containing protein [Candidatus Pacearchaeota archaeon]